jgi:hypothetical protein
MLGIIDAAAHLGKVVGFGEGLLAASQRTMILSVVELGGMVSEEESTDVVGI